MTKKVLNSIPPVLQFMRLFVACIFAVVVAPVHSDEADLNSKRIFGLIVNRDIGAGGTRSPPIQWFMAQKQSSWMGAIAFSNEHFNLAGGMAINFAFAARRLIKYTQTGNWAP
jgi:hypothetical protein